MELENFTSNLDVKKRRVIAKSDNNDIPLCVVCDKSLGSDKCSDKFKLFSNNLNKKLSRLLDIPLIKINSVFKRETVRARTSCKRASRLCLACFKKINKLDRALSEIMYFREERKHRFLFIAQNVEIPVNILCHHSEDEQSGMVPDPSIVPNYYIKEESLDQTENMYTNSDTEVSRSLEPLEMGVEVSKPTKRKYRGDVIGSKAVSVQNERFQSEECNNKFTTATESCNNIQMATKIDADLGRSLEMSVSDSVLEDAKNTAVSIKSDINDEENWCHSEDHSIMLYNEETAEQVTITASNTYSDVANSLDMAVNESWSENVHTMKVDEEDLYENEYSMEYKKCSGENDECGDEDKKHVKPQYSLEDLDKALKAVQGGLSYGKASLKYKVPKSTIFGKYKGKSPGHTIGRPTILSLETESEIAERCLIAASYGFGDKRRLITQKVTSIVNMLKIPNHFTNGKPGPKWWQNFRKRHPEISVREEKDQQEVITYLQKINLLNNANKFPSHAIWNVSETTIQIASKCQETVSILGAVNASGGMVPPMFAFKGRSRKATESFNLSDAPSNSTFTYQKSEEDRVGVEWFITVFLQHCGPHRPQLLIMDKYSSHETLDLLEHAQKANIILLATPPGTNHLQPLLLVFESFKQAYNNEADKFLSLSQTNMNKSSFLPIFTKAWNAKVTATSILSAFKSMDIAPCNPDDNIL